MREWISMSEKSVVAKWEMNLRRIATIRGALHVQGPLGTMHALATKAKKCIKNPGHDAELGQHNREVGIKTYLGMATYQLCHCCPKKGVWQGGRGIDNHLCCWMDITWHE